MWWIANGDSREVLRAMADGSVDSVVCDPPYELGFMGKRWDASGIAYDVGLWAEVLRVLKPGGHLLAFGGTRTYHRMACAIEDAGFEVRDSIHWIYGSGFPKSLDVSKAIDKQRYDRADIYRVTAWVRAARDAARIGNRDIDEAFGFAGMAGHWTSAKSQPAVPTLEQVPLLLGMLGLTIDDVPEDIRRLLLDLNGRKGQPGENWWKREVTGQHKSAAPGQTWSANYGINANLIPKEQRDIPATDAARQWAGWGTALKPAFEPVVIAMKPATIGSCLSWLYAKIAKADSASNQSAFVEAFASVLRNAERNNATRVDSFEAMAMSPFESERALSLSTVSSWQRTWAAISEHESTSTTSTETRPTTESAILLCCLSKLMHENIGPNAIEFSSLVVLVDSLFRASAHRLDAIQMLAAIGIATEKPHQAFQAKDEESPHKPIVVARKPLDGTVAANVLAHGTGAINVDGCRVSASGPSPSVERRKGKPLSAPSGVWPTHHDRSAWSAPHPGEDLGRWPPNILLSHAPDCGDECADGCAVAEMDGQSGGASRFFPVFRYQAKASRADRDAGLEAFSISSGASIAGRAEGSAGSKHARAGTVGPRANVHPTVKPTELMRWLVRLVTPPGGLVLDPFTGSGSTGVAAVLEGFRFAGVELSPEYVEIARARVAHAEANRPATLPGLGVV